MFSYLRIYFWLHVFRISDVVVLLLLLLLIETLQLSITLSVSVNDANSPSIRSRLARNKQKD